MIVSSSAYTCRTSWSTAADELATCLDQHLSLSPQEREVMSAKCQETARSMTVENNVRQLVTVFEEVLVEKNRA